MLQVYECVRQSSAPWAIGDRVAYAPFDFRDCVLVLGETGARSYGTEMIPAVHRDAFNGALTLLYDEVEDSDIVEMLIRDVGGC